MKNALFLSTAQQLSLTPQVQQAIRLLQMSSQELDQELSQLLQSNPFLELQEPDTALELEPLDRLSALVDDRDDASEGRDAWGDTYAARAVVADVTQIIEQRQHALPQSLQQHLLTQMVDLHLAPAMRWMLEFVIQSVDDDGFLTSGLDELLQDVQLELSRAEVEQAEDELQALLMQAVAYLRSMEPAGVGATDWRHSVQLQLQRQLQHLRQPVAVIQQSSSPHPTAPMRAACADGVSEQIMCTQHALLLLKQDVKALARKDIRQLAQMTGLTADAVRQALNYLSTFSAHPGRAFGVGDNRIVVPDLLVVRKAGDWAVEVNPRLQRKLNLYDPYVQAWGDYARAQRKNKSDEGLSGGAVDRGGAALVGAVGASALEQRDWAGDAMAERPVLEPMQQHLQDAKAMVKALAQRYNTLHRVGQVIVQRQRAYMQHGAQAMRPMTLKDVADELGLHESTISRATTQKYMQTPHGVQELKYFFSSQLGSRAFIQPSKPAMGSGTSSGLQSEITTTLALASNHGGAISSEAVRSLIAAWIGAENPKKPLSDQRIADRLKEQGVDCARRTVAKYREALQIAPTHLRKSL